MSNEIKESGMMYEIAKLANELGIGTDDMYLAWHTDFEAPYFILLNEADNDINNKILTRKIMELMVMNKIDNLVKNKFGVGGWKKWNLLHGFNQYWLRKKIKHAAETLNGYLFDLDHEIDIKPRHKTPEEIKQELINTGQILDIKPLDNENNS